jgi:hypothetical protein
MITEGSLIGFIGTTADGVNENIDSYRQQLEDHEDGNVPDSALL